MQNYVYLGPTPHDEPCTSAGHHPTREAAECLAFVHQMRRIMGPEPEGARIKMKYFYTGGGYRDVVCEYDEGNQDAARYAYACEEKSPARWDLFALVELTAGLAPISGDGAWRETY